MIFQFPGLGGHHLANLIALSGRYNYVVDYSKYFDPNYQSAAHFETRSNDNSIVVDHFGSIDTVPLFREVSAMPNCQFIVIHFPRNNDLAWKRLNQFNAINMKKHHFRHDLEKIYKQEYLAKIYPGTWNTVMADALFDKTDVAQFIHSLESKLDIEISDRRLATSVHQQWLKNLENTLADFKLH